ncbi:MULTISPECIES: dTDP-4-dehydrorhamnose reductase [unclassified Paraburkholderia]|uniref:dTDP-4-dehydrorhamnose reductase n=1 Tax=unclassified Paraburkholderia TaxID=2615204 RepID=UPI000D07127D|nr:MULTISPECIES: dTDP-4-dehydrorhamnose reductase [unclassified Paraburkholderia]PRY04161.1 dTDP-4-dehydrorhamnose reductase [Paraburkholderia sp. BL25I1N1]RKR37812.1 dTDP-4-dehydrorhamnose reductase [Paraburkholderia sp. BL17N1]
MRIAVTGVQGQLGWELARSLSPLGEVVRWDREVADLSKPALLDGLMRFYRPDVVVNAAAYTAVDKAEDDCVTARLVNTESVDVMARAAKSAGALFVHFSTDYVFDGKSAEPYTEDSETAPLNVYGATKRDGELAIIASECDHLIFRTSWVYATRGANFMLTMLRLAAEREALKIVDDQLGTPTPARMLANVTAHAISQAMRERQEARFQSGLFHLTSRGVTSWHGYASAIIDYARNLAPSGRVRVTHIEPVPSEAFPTRAARPRNSALNNDRFDERFGLVRPHWWDALAQTLDERFERTA